MTVAGYVGWNSNLPRVGTNRKYCSQFDLKKTTCSMTKGVCLSQNTSKLLQTNQFAIEQM